MALTKISRGLLSTGVSDSSDATAITIDSSEQVGVGTTSPQRQFHIAGGSNTGLKISGNASGSASGDGFDIFVRDDNSGVELVQRENTFMTFHTNNSERMRIDASGQLGLGVTPNTNFRNDATAAEKFFQIGNAAVLFSDSGVTTALANNCAINNSDARIALTGTNHGSMYEQYLGIHTFYTTDSVAAGNSQTLTARFRIAVDGTLTGSDTDGIGSISDERVKKNIVDYTGGLDLIKSLRPRTFEFKDTTGVRKTGTQRGFIAQEVLTEDSYWISEEKATDNKDSEYDYTKDTEKRYISKLNSKDAVLVSAIKELLAKVEELESKIDG